MLSILQVFDASAGRWLRVSVQANDAELEARAMHVAGTLYGLRYHCIVPYTV